jgi:transposase
MRVCTAPILPRHVGADGPPTFDKERYKRREVVERFFNRFRQWRALATRYAKRSPSRADR